MFSAETKNDKGEGPLPRNGRFATEGRFTKCKFGKTDREGGGGVPVARGGKPGPGEGVPVASPPWLQLCVKCMFEALK